MKNRISRIISIIIIMGGINSCVEFLDQTPDAVAFSDEDIFTDYTKSQQFVDQLLVRYMYLDDLEVCNDDNHRQPPGSLYGKNSYGLRERMTDNCLASKQYWWHPVNNERGDGRETWSAFFTESDYARFNAKWKGIRVCNLAISNIDRITNATLDQKAKILGQAYFMRGHFYFKLLQGWGGMPFIARPLDPEMNMDLKRDSYIVTAQKIAAGCDTAATYLPMTWPDEEWGRPTKMSALGLKAQALIWAASPFANPSNDQGLWEDAAIACAQAIDAAEKSGYYYLVNFDNFKNLFTEVNSETFHEIIWGRFQGNFFIQWSSYYSGIKSVAFGSGSMGAESVTENLAQCYPWNNGEPVDPTTEEYAHYPYSGDGVTHTGRDPRFYKTLLFNGASTPQVASYGRNVEIWNKSFDGRQANECKVDATYQAVSGYTYTGYYNYKLFANAFLKFGNRADLMWNFIRMADLYLWYAEAANRAWGPTVPPSGPRLPAGFSMTAVQSLNKVRNRAGMPSYDPASPKAFLQPGNVDEFEQKIRNESRIEMAFEEKRFYDLRRWRLILDPDVIQMKGLYIDKTAADEYNYSVVMLPELYNLHWTERNYLFKISPFNTYLGPNFEQNPGW